MSEVAVLGPQGTYTEKAAKKTHPGYEITYFDDVASVFEYAASGKGVGVVAAENSLEGSVGHTMQALMEYDTYITKETELDIRIALLAPAGLGLEDVKKVLSHPHALGQCRNYLRKNIPHAVRQPTSSTAEAMKISKDSKDAAAAGDADTGKQYELNVLAQDIQDTDSKTRFLTISKNPGRGDKTSVIFAVKDEAGALYSVLKTFADEDINLTKIESRPRRRNLGEYVFYVDYLNQGRDIDTIHEKIKKQTTYFKYLGSY